MMKTKKRIPNALLLLLLLLGSAWAQEAAPAAASVRKITDLKPTVILISIDGYRWDFPDKYPSPNLRELIRTGVRAEMIPSFPSKTFPNHYTLVTGLYPGHHGIIANNMWDDEMKAGFKMDDRAAVHNARWWGGEPIWVTLHKQGQKAAAMFWPGSEAPIQGVYPDYWQAFDDKMEHSKRVQWVLQQLDRPAEERPTFSTLYFSAVDTAGHDFGPGTEEVRAAVMKVDDSIGELMQGLKERGIYDRVNLIVVADHGMASISNQGQLFLEDFVDLDKVQVVDWSPVLAIRAKDGNNEALYEQLKKMAHVKVFRKAQLPERFHYRANPRVMPIIGIADLGWGITTRKRMANRKKEERGTHGYDPAVRDMHAVFIAHGPAFQQGVTLKPFENVNVYPAIAQILGVKPAKNDGDAKVIGGGMVKSKAAGRGTD
jgi:predicted AlkP superfamily pyrophosphatase or phosphodiesterase